MAWIEHLQFWRFKTSRDNEWRPFPGHDPYHRNTRLPSQLRRLDLDAAVVDVSPFIAGAGSLAYLRQLPHLGWTVPVNPFHNKGTMLAVHRTGLFLTPLVLLLQGLGKDYRLFIPRWSHDRERRRDEAEVRMHVDGGMAIGLVGWSLRMFVLGWGKKYWFPIDVVLCGGLADLLHREHAKAHGF